MPKKTEAEEATVKLFEKVLKMMEDAEDRLFNGKTPLHEGLEEDLQAVLEDIDLVIERDKEIRKNLGINEEEFQQRLQNREGMSKDKLAMLDRLDRLQQEIRLREHDLSMELKGAERNEEIDDVNVETSKKVKKRKKKFKRLGGDGKSGWIPL